MTGTSKAELPRRRQPPMAGDDIAVLADQDRVGEAEGADAAGDLGDLRIAVGAGIAGVGNQPLDRPLLEAEVPSRCRPRPGRCQRLVSAR